MAFPGIPGWLLEQGDHGEVMTAGPPVGLEVTVQLRQQLKTAWETVTRMTRDSDPNTNRAVSETVLKLMEMVMVHDIHVSKVVTDFQEKIHQVQQQAQSQGSWSGKGGGHGGPQDRQWKQRITESKGASNLKQFDGQEDKFKEWVVKLMNVFSVVHPGSRDFLKSICQKCSMTVKELPEDEYEDLVNNLPWVDAEKRESTQ